MVHGGVVARRRRLRGLEGGLGGAAAPPRSGPGRPERRHAGSSRARRSAARGSRQAPRSPERVPARRRRAAPAGYPVGAARKRPVVTRRCCLARGSRCALCCARNRSGAGRDGVNPGGGKIVVLGVITRMPVAGAIWWTLNYLVGLRRLGFDVYYVEAHGDTPDLFIEHEDDEGTEKAAAFLDGVMGRFGLGDRWAYHAVHEDRSCYGLDEEKLGRLYREAELIINLNG